MSRYSRRGGWGWGGFPPYVTMDELREKAVRVAERIAKKEKRELHGIRLEGRTIAKTFWGKAWCDNIESYRDYEYRLERGRRYVRAGSVIDLQIEKGQVRALVVGSGCNPYRISIDIETMPPAKWDELVKRMTGKISSLMALAAGTLPKDLLAEFCDAEAGLFPKSGEIRLSCNCPDGAVCCKHVAAVLYGIGSRLDEAPELFFTLRGVDPKTIVSSEAVVGSLTDDAASELDSSDLGDVFGISLDSEILDERPAKAKDGPGAKTKTEGSAKSKAVSSAKGEDEATLFKDVRRRLHLSQAVLAARLGTYQTVISQIERGMKKPRPEMVEKLRSLG